MNDEIIVISDNIQRDLREFKNQFNEYISKMKTYGIIELKNGNILKFYSNGNLVGLRNFKYYSEIYEHFLKYQNKDLQHRMNKAIEYIEEYQYLIVDNDSKEELLEILRGVDDE